MGSHYSESLKQDIEEIKEEIKEVYYIQEFEKARNLKKN